MLNSDEIINRQIFVAGTYSNSSFTNACYDLRISDFILVDNVSTKLSKFELRPREMVVVVTSEEFDMPNDVVAYTTLNNDLSIKGILAINTGIVDPLFKGPISTALINFGKKKILLSKSDPVMRVTFHDFDVPAHQRSKSLVFTRKSYTDNRHVNALEYLGRTFLNIDLIKEDVLHHVRTTLKEEENSINNRLIWLGVKLGVLTVFVTIICYLIGLFNK